MTNSKVRHSKKRILVVEDDALDFQYLQFCFSEWTFEAVDIVWASTVEAAERHLVSSKFDLVVLDYNIGTRTPFALVKHFRNKECRVPVMVMSSHHPSGIKDFVEAIEATVFVDKTIMTSQKVRDGMISLGLNLAA